MPYANNKGADQSAYPRSLISTFVVRWLDSMISLVSISEISSQSLASVTVQAGLCLTWSQTLKTGFLVTRLNSVCYSWNFKTLVSSCSWADLFESWSETPEDRFSRDMAHFRKDSFCMSHGIKHLNEPRHDKTNKVSMRPAKTQISLIRVFAVRSMAS